MYENNTERIERESSPSASNKSRKKKSLQQKKNQNDIYWKMSDRIMIERAPPAHTSTSYSIPGECVMRMHYKDD